MQILSHTNILRSRVHTHTYIYIYIDILYVQQKSIIRINFEEATATGLGCGNLFACRFMSLIGPSMGGGSGTGAGGAGGGTGARGGGGGGTAQIITAQIAGDGGTVNRCRASVTVFWTCAPYYYYYS